MLPIYGIMQGIDAGIEPEKRFQTIPIGSMIIATSFFELQRKDLSWEAENNKAMRVSQKMLSSDS